ncbi:hypothetical protein [Paracoccus sp. (in: a-proteobacteria)]|uniref:hypothetical protein n=1 Tax=Paracoccus sp. TaxID=267 RepID=UPI0026DF5BA5|nr:hypothetical protein [Paracoccus sp. (in: a-proteobacteria)]MDO5646307.1 hypothetical protein [Paracoccus sp. (in: a-proteobacteria)]
MTPVIALTSIEGKKMIAPGSVFEADGALLTHLESAYAVRKATQDEITLAKTKGLYLESEGTDEPAAPKAAAPKAGAKGAGAKTEEL